MSFFWAVIGSYIHIGFGYHLFLGWGGNISEFFFFFRCFNLGVYTFYELIIKKKGVAARIPAIYFQELLGGK